MPQSPNQPPTGTQFELRMAASSLELDALLSNMTKPDARTYLPGYLFLYSEKKFTFSQDDRDIDGNSFNETQFRGFKMRVTNHNRNKYGLGATAEKVQIAKPEHELQIRVGTQLGIQAASEIMIPPFFSRVEKSTTALDMYYTIPAPISGRAMEVAFSHLSSYLEQQPRGIVDELMLVESAMRERSIRQRLRPEAAIAPLITMVQPVSLLDIELVDSEGVV